MQTVWEPVCIFFDTMKDLEEVGGFAIDSYRVAHMSMWTALTSANSLNGHPKLFRMHHKASLPIESRVLILYSTILCSKVVS